MRAALTIMTFCLLAACGQASDQPAASEKSNTFDVTEADSVSDSQAAPTRARIAYVYRLGFVLPGVQLAVAQRKHVAFCEKLGNGRCQLLAMQRSNDSGSVRMRVDARLAKSFSSALEQAVAGEGGRTSDSAIEAEDITKQTIDAEARLRQRELLVSRLTDLLRNRQGSVGDLVAAEKAVADAQEELDQAHGWLGELRGRVAMSTFEVSYSTRVPAADGSVGALMDDSRNQLLRSLRALLTFAIIALPWIVVGGGLVWAFRRWRGHRRARRMPEV